MEPEWSLSSLSSLDRHCQLVTFVSCRLEEWAETRTEATLCLLNALKHVTLCHGCGFSLIRLGPSTCIFGFDKL